MKMQVSVMHASGTRTARVSTPWLETWSSAADDERMRLFCFPYAGAGAGVFRRWREHLPDIAVAGVQLPGRESRFAEPLIQCLETVTVNVAAALRSHLDRPFAFFGHSVGALIAYETAQLLSRDGIAPVRLFVSAMRAPAMQAATTPIAQLTQPSFVREVETRYGGIPTEIINDDELLDLFVPILRADMGMAEAYRHSNRPPLPSNMSILGGEDDHAVPQSMLAPWARHTTGESNLRMYPGGHFFIESSLQSVLRDLREDLLNDTRGLEFRSSK